MFLRSGGRTVRVRTVGMCRRLREQLHMQDNQHSPLAPGQQPMPPASQSWAQQGISPYAAQPGVPAGRGMPARPGMPAAGVRTSREEATARASGRRAPVEPRMSKGEALSVARSLKVAAAALSVVGFGAFAALVAGHLTSSSGTQTQSGGSAVQPGTSGGSDDDGGFWHGDDGGFFGQGGSSFGSGNVQQPSSSSGV